MSSDRPKGVSAAEEIADSVDLIQEIHLRLPVKSLIKFQLVSKDWQDLIYDPEFARAHTQRNINKSSSGFFFYDASRAGIFLKSVPPSQTNPNQIGSIPLLEDFLFRTGMLVVQSCNGLMLCSTTPTGHPTEYYILNPTTRKLKELPHPEHDTTSAEPSRNFGSLAYDPSLSSNYKVVHVSCSGKRRGKSTIFVYSSESTSWRICTGQLKPNSSVDEESGTYWNGAIYWASTNGYSIRFDVKTERLELFKMPRSPNACSRCFGHTRDRLHVASVSHPSAQRFSVHELPRDGGWKMFYTINVSNLLTAVRGVGFTSDDQGDAFPFYVICVIKGEAEFDTELVLWIPGKVIAYSYYKRTVRILLEREREVEQMTIHNFLPDPHRRISWLDQGESYGSSSVPLQRRPKCRANPQRRDDDR